MSQGSQSRRSNRTRQSPAPLEDAVEEEPAISPAAEEELAEHRIPVDKKLALIYGKERPRDSPPDVCAFCLKHSGHSVQEPVLLCDGYQCHREYHLSCANLSRIPAPEEAFYCFDCHPVGHRCQALRRYLAQHNDERNVADTDPAWSQAGVWNQFIARDRRRMNGSARGSRKKVSTAAVGSEGDEPPKIPRSELHDPCLWESPGLSSTSSTTDVSWLIGCPMRLYVPQLNDYVAGRIVAERPVTSAVPASPSHTTTNALEHYVRFPAGTFEMKQAVHAWIMLEEHALLVHTATVRMNLGPIHTATASPAKPHTGEKRTHVQAGLSPETTTIQSASSPPRAATFKVVTAWARTSRELLSIKNIHLQPIPFYEIDESPWHLRTSRRAAAHIVIIREFDTTEHFGFVDAACLDPFDDTTNNTAAVDHITLSLLRSELVEKKRVREWYRMGSAGARQRYGGSLKKDVDEFPPLSTQQNPLDRSTSLAEQVETCPCIRGGLDRVYIAERLRKLDVPVGKGEASNISCLGSTPLFFQADINS
jgi:hypothetical protein